MIIVIVKIYKVGNPTPNLFSKTKGDLIVPFYCINDKRQRIIVKILGTKPRFWAEENPLQIELYQHEQPIMEKIIEVVDEGFKTFGSNKKCWTVYTKYPFEISAIKDVLHGKKIKTNMADVPYQSLVRIIYGFNSPFIETPGEMTTVDVNDIKSIKIGE